MIKITFLYAAGLALFFVYLSYRVIRLRFSTKTSLGDGGDEALTAAIRTHGNFSEFIPLGLILISGLEVFGYSNWVVHLFGALLFLGRILHFLGMKTKNSLGRARPAGMMITFTVLVISSFLLLIKGLQLI